MTRLLPGMPLADFTLPLVGGGSFNPAQSGATSFALLLAYRGLHCPLCKVQLVDLLGRLDALAERGMTAMAFSMNDAEAAAKTKADWGLENLPIGYDLTAEQARSLGLYLSEGRAGSAEPSIFCEPGMFVIKSDGTLFFASVQNLPFARPAFDDLLRGIDYVMTRDYPARGTIA